MPTSILFVRVDYRGTSRYNYVAGYPEKGFRVAKGEVLDVSLQLVVASSRTMSIAMFPPSFCNVLSVAVSNILEDASNSICETSGIPPT